MTEPGPVPDPMQTEQRSRRIAVTGAGGLVGSALAASLTNAGHLVIPLVRRPVSPGATEISWDPVAGRIDAQALSGLDALVNLAGENIAAGRWNRSRKERIRSSRVDGTRLIAEALAGLEQPPRVLVNASAIGYYGDRGDEWMDEDADPGTGFLSDTCVEWEKATGPAAQAGVRVVRLRIGVVLSSAGGALARMLPIFRYGLGGRLGDGRQQMSWILLDDLVRVLEYALLDESLRGAVNGVAPNPVTNVEFTKTLASVLGRPALLPAPAFMLRTLLGEMGQELLLSSTRVRPARLSETTFRYRFPDLDSGLRFELGKRSRED